MPAALELRGEQQMLLQLFLASCSSTPRTQCWKATWSKSSRNIDILTAKSFFYRVFTVNRALVACG